MNTCRVSTALLCLAIIGCDTPAATTTTPDPAMEKRVADLEAAVAALKVRVDVANKRIDFAQRMANLGKPTEFLEFDPSDAAYGVLDGRMGKFAVSVQDIRQFGDGVKVTINLGNASSATYNGAELDLEYGARSPADLSASSEANDAWLKSMRTKNETITARLLPGSWNPVTVTLPQIEQKNFGYLQVRIRTNQIQMR